MNWGLLVLGFLAFLLVCLLALWFVRSVTQVTPTVVSTPAELQEILRALLSAGNDGETLFVVWFPSRFEVRVTKHSRKSKPPTLAVEVRNSENNRNYYAQARASLDAQGLDFSEDFKPAHQQPDGLRLLWPDGGPFVVSAAANAIAVLEAALPSSTISRCAASCQLPSKWRATEVRVA